MNHQDFYNQSKSAPRSIIINVPVWALVIMFCTAASMFAVGYEAHRDTYIVERW